jgi:GntR family transcriptional regulator
VQSPKDEVDLFSLAGTMSSFHKKGFDTATRILKKIRLVNVRKKETENPFAGGKAFFYERLTSVDGSPVLIETMYLHPELFKGIDELDLAGKSLSEIVSGRYYMKPTGGKQNFRIGYLNGKRARDLEITPSTPVLSVNRLLHFSQADCGLFSELFCRTDKFVFSQTIGGLTNV